MTASETCNDIEILELTKNVAMFPALTIARILAPGQPILSARNSEASHNARIVYSAWSQQFSILHELKFGKSHRHERGP